MQLTIPPDSPPGAPSVEGDQIQSQPLLRDPSRGAPELSVVILGYREEERLRNFVSAVQAVVKELDVTCELVLVANYWPDSGDRIGAFSRLAVAPALSPRRQVARERNRRYGRFGASRARGCAAS